MTRYLTSCVFLAALAAFSAAPVAAQSRYTFTRIADTSNFPDGFGRRSRSTMTGGWRLWPCGQGEWRVYSSGEAARSPRSPIRPEPSLLWFSGINGLGQATFFAKGRSPRRILCRSRRRHHDRRKSRRRARTGGDIFSSPSGTFSAVEIVPRLPRQPKVIVAGDGGRAIRIADTSGLFQSLDLDPRVNASGRVAFHARRRDFSEGIFVGKGGALTTIADTSGPS